MKSLWVSVIDDVTNMMHFYERGLLRQVAKVPHARHIEPMVLGMTNPIISAWNESPPSIDSALYPIVANLTNEANRLSTSDPFTKPKIDYLDMLRSTKEQINAIEATPTLDEIMSEMDAEFKISIITARLGHIGVSNLIDKARLGKYDLKSPKAREASYIDALTTEFSTHAGSSSIGTSALIAHISAGTMSYEDLDAWVSHEPKDEPATSLSRFVGQWVVHYQTIWDSRYRRVIAENYGCDKADVTSPFFGDLAALRNDFAHNRGRAKNSRKNKIINWGSGKNQLLNPTQEHYRALFDAFQEALKQLQSPPTPNPNAKLNNPIGKVPPGLNSEFAGLVQTIDGHSVNSAIEDAMRSWIEKHKES